ncbi:MAG: L-2-amino-thiazoline-4-carboxylic acid hydrolase [Candidatus Thorarchaeota archaeon]
MKVGMFKPFSKKLIRRKAWGVHKKAIVQILTPRCRRNGMPEHGRFTAKEMENIIFRAESHIQGLIPYFKDHDNIGNYMNEYGGLIHLAIYRAMVEEKIDPSYATNLVADLIWQVRVTMKGVVPIIDPLRLKLAKLRTKDPVAYLEKRLKDALKFPYSEPGYKTKLYKDGDVFHLDIFSCPVHDFYAQFGQEEMNFFRRTWCTYDYTVAEHLVEGGKYQREHTLSDGDEVCDMRYFISK